MPVSLTAALGCAFLYSKHTNGSSISTTICFLASRFAMTGDDAGGAQLFWSFYFVATGLHGLHMIVGVGLVGWIARAAHRRRFSASISHACGSGRTLLELRRHGVALPLSDDLSRASRRFMTDRARHAGLACDFCCCSGWNSAWRIRRWRGVVPFIGCGMAVLVALTFMRLGRDRGLPPIFAMAGVFWLLIILGLGNLDSFTRHDIPARPDTPATPAR